MRPDSQLVVRQGMEDKAATVWADSGPCSYQSLISLSTSQPLAVSIHRTKASIGGVAWPNVNFDDMRFDYAFTVWGNSTLGIVVYSGGTQVNNLAEDGNRPSALSESLPVLDFRTLTDEQLSTAESIFDDFRDKDLKPAFLADADPNRALLDRRVICDLLGFDDSVYEAVRRLSAKWCAEPSVHGGKKRPRGAGVV